MSAKKLSMLMGMTALAILFTGCNENEIQEAEDGFDVQFVLPSFMETATGLLTFEVIDGKNPLLTDTFILEPVGDQGVFYSYLCSIIETSPSEFTVELFPSCASGRYNVYIRREEERKSYGIMAFDYVKVGTTLSKWYEGALDIHLISTGHGECTYQILPDGTTFLSDASGSTSNDKSLWRPNADATAGHTIVNYINHFSPAASSGHINYFLLTHHHSDHMGTVSGTAEHSSGEFKLSSVCEIGSSLVMDKIFDRDWPNFDYPTPTTSSTMMTNYKAFLNWTTLNNGTVVEKWRVGSKTQVVPVNDSSWDVTVRSYAGNGCFWTGGADEKTFTLMPTAEEFAVMDDDDIPDENQFSCAYILTYGKFDFFLGGDLMFVSYTNNSDNIEDIPYPYFDAESPMLDALHKVEVMKANHHGCPGSHSPNFVNKLAPDVWIIGVWSGSTPNSGPASRIVAANPDVEVFSTYQGTSAHNSLVNALGEEEYGKHFVSTYGHTVIRVTPGGGSYMVYTLEDSDEEYIVKSIHGPYTCGD